MKRKTPFVKTENFENEMTISSGCRERFLPLAEPNLCLLTDYRLHLPCLYVIPKYEIHRFLPRWHTLIYTVSGGSS